MIAGSGKGGPSEVDAERVWGYMCPGGTLVGGSATSAPTCKTNLTELVIRFPDCWNGVDLDSPDHKSHMAYSRRVAGAALRTCPATHLRLMPMLQLILRYPTAGGPSLQLSSGAINTAHADFMNGWDQPRLSALVRDCLVADMYCGGGDAPDVHTTAAHRTGTRVAARSVRTRQGARRRTRRQVARTRVHRHRAGGHRRAPAR